jgi:large subunit ribosomal protein L15
MLDELKPRPGARRGRKRVGRGPGSGTGKTAGRGTKGQGKRSPGREVPFHFEGGQMPLARRLPKRGFHNVHRKAVQIVNTGDLAVFGDGATVDVEGLVRRGLVRADGAAVKLLGEGDVPRQLTIQVHRVSSGARAKVEAAGGSVELIG